MHQKVRLYIWILLYQAVNHGSALYHFHLLTVGQIDCNLAPKKILKFQNPYKFPIGDSECGLIFEKILKFQNPYKFPIGDSECGLIILSPVYRHMQFPE